MCSKYDALFFSRAASSLSRRLISALPCNAFLGSFRLFEIVSLIKSHHSLPYGYALRLSVSSKEFRILNFHTPLITVFMHGSSELVKLIRSFAPAPSLI